MKKIILSVLLIVCVLCQAGSLAAEKYSDTWIDLFDTVFYMIGYADDEAAFQETAQSVYDELRAYHRLYDAYNDYEGINNIKTINDCAGGKPVKVDQAIIDLLQMAREICAATDGRVDVTIGSVTALWHEARTESLDDPDNAYIPSGEALAEAKCHAGIELLEIDAENNTVRLTDPDARLDVGALAKGYALQRVIEKLPEGYLLSGGGNVCVSGAKPDGSKWAVGVQKPYADYGEYLHALMIERGAIVTSGDYQRYYTVNGINYHHIIDPDTLHPARLWRAVTVICSDSGIADGLSTALFLSDREDGQKLLNQYDAQALWITCEGELIYSDGYEAYIR